MRFGANLADDLSVLDYSDVTTHELLSPALNSFGSAVEETPVKVFKGHSGKLLIPMLATLPCRSPKEPHKVSGSLRSRGVQIHERALGSQKIPVPVRCHVFVEVHAGDRVLQRQISCDK